MGWAAARTPGAAAFTLLPGATGSGTITLSASSSDNVGVARVQFRCDDIDFAGKVL